MTGLQIVKDVKAANKSDLSRLRRDAQKIINIHKRWGYCPLVAIKIERSPIAIKLHIEENNGNIDSLERFKSNLNLLMETTA